MNALEFYNGMRSELTRRAELGELVNDYDARGNLAYFCRNYEGDYDEFLEKCPKMTTKEFCDALSAVICGTGKNLEDAAESYRSSVREYFKIGEENSFTLISRDLYPKWFIAHECMSAILLNSTAR